MTWLELMMLYVIRGGRVDDAHGPTAHLALPRPGILPAIQLFKRVVKDVLALYGGPIAQCFSSQVNNGYHRLEPWQITNHMPCVSFNAWASDEEQVQIAKGILSFRCAITRKNASAIQEGTLHLAPAPHHVRGRLEWHKLFTPTTQLVATLVNIRKEAAQARTHNQNKQHVVNTLQLTCTQCSTARTASYHSLLGPKGWKRIWCSGQCHRSWASKKWQCACGMLWHMCVVHAHGNFSAPPTPTATRRAPRTRMQQALPCPMPAKCAKQNPCMLTFPDRTPPAASPDATDDKRGRKRKGSESAEQPPKWT